MEKPAKMDQALFDLVTSLFSSDEEEVELVIKSLQTARVSKIDRARLLSRDELMKTGLPLGLAGELHAALVAVVNAPAPVQVETPTDRVLGSLASTLQNVFGGQLDQLPVDKLIDRLIDSGGSDPTVLAFADQQHVQLSRFGVVLKSGAGKEIDRAATLDYLRQSRVYLGQRWANQRVVRVTDAFGVKEEFSPFAPTRPLQNGVDPETGADFKTLQPLTRNFLAWVAQNKPALMRDDGLGLLDVLLDKEFDGLKKHARFGKAVIEYEEVCSDDPSLATKYLPQLYRAPGAPVTSGLGAAPGRPFGIEPARPAATVATGGWARGFSTALLSAFPRESDLERLLCFEMNENLNAISGAGSMTTRVYQVIMWAESKGRLGELLKAAYDNNRGNMELSAFYRSMAEQPPFARPKTEQHDVSSGNWSHEKHIRFREVMAQLYQTQSAASILLTDIGVEPYRIDMGGAPKTAWFNIVSHVKNHGWPVFDRLVARAKKDYPSMLTEF